MKKLVLIAILMLMFSGQSFAAKRAYLVCIGDYPAEKGWARISSGNDLAILSGALSGDFIVESLSDSMATYDNLVNFLRRISETAAPSDTVLIHFSCHGQQMSLEVDDADRDIDGLDEALVPYDAEREYSEHYKGERHLRDSEFGELSESVRYALGPGGLLIVTFDACHSDSMVRGDGKPFVNGSVIRGYAGIFGPEPDSLTLAKLREMHAVQDTAAVRTRAGQCEEILISACKASDRNRETVQDGKGYGSLSYAIASAYEKSSGIDDVDGFVASVIAEMKVLHPGQQPVVRSSFHIDIASSADTVVGSDEKEKNTGWPRFFLIPAILIFAVALVCRIRKK